MISLLALLGAIASAPSDNASRLAADVRDFAVPRRFSDAPFRPGRNRMVGPHELLAAWLARVHDH